MAGDLIPPPSPAGRPEPDSSEKLTRRPHDGLWAAREDESPPPAPEAPAPQPAAPAVESRYRPRFGLVLGAVIGVALALAGLGLVVSLNADDGVPDGWSAWRPTAGDELGTVRQIAEHVAPSYRLGDANQLVAIQSGGLEIAGRPLSVALRAAPVGGDIHLLEGHGVMYTLNGLGPNGSIKTGEPSEERHLLLRREAVELTLYTFRYAEDVDMVVTLLPPRPPAKGEPASATPVPPVQALFFRPGDLAGELDVPLAATIPPATPRPETFPKTGPEAQRIETLTGSNLFTATFQQDQDASAFLVLERQG
ncbi:MAG: hypothetical protein ACR2L8_06985 [Solirubrobacteraceae bacterium]